MTPNLQLPAGRKVRARRAPAVRPRESKLHTAVAKLLRAHCLPTWQWTFISRKAKDAREGAILKRMGANPGWADFIFISPYGSARFLELKRPGEEIDPDSPQGEFRIWCIAHGVPHVVAETMDHVLKTLDSWGCLRIRTSSVTYAHEDLA